MNVEHLETIHDPRLAPYGDLTGKRGHPDAGILIAESRFLVERLLASTLAVESILVDNPAKVPDLPPGREATPIFCLPRPQLQKLVGFNFHRGVMACGRRPDLTDLRQVAWPDQERLTLSVAAQVVDPENLGSLIRASSAFGADALLVDDRCGDPFSRRALRVSTGHAFKIPIVVATDLLEQLENAKSLGFQLIATALDETATPLKKETVRDPRAALLFGNEGFGLDADVLEIADRRVTIPMERGSDSLNVAMAAGVFLYHYCYML
ncbi:TrmH family RNA methyltransferase [Blastopirellula retiformator]|uniref:Putative TrmH family tRNA/rRNA methyltransferase n=1 Tax=Blastopirellula retiformator TaxID=2527970 RepID=A0A5C5USY8_9BACT|nr:RNA methyltransferase [Blastopirellula retiformator]TWT29296.1 putative TrmH family tRNA/rRNA methyltransferase [Blastopirellula retiformator]